MLWLRACVVLVFHAYIDLFGLEEGGRNKISKLMCLSRSAEMATYQTTYALCMIACYCLIMRSAYMQCVWLFVITSPHVSCLPACLFTAKLLLLTTSCAPN